MAKVIMVQGTMSNAGKSLVVAALCRILKQDGYRVCPFKSQNMALNSFITKEGLEMGRAQVVQAQAAGIEPSALMNPILLKPNSDVGSQVIVNGKPIGNQSAKEYFANKTKLIPEIKKAFCQLEQMYDVIVIEGAGSPAEINLKQNDIVNMGLAKMVDAPVILVSDIDRGGVFAQLYGTVMLLEDEEKARIKGLIINKFRGDKTILDPGIKQIEKMTGIDVVGVLPYLSVDIEDEDSLSEKLFSKKGKGQIDLAIIHFPRLSNFTDFDVLRQIEGVNVRYVRKSQELGNPDLIILPGTKSTVEDLLWMRQNGLEAAIQKQAANQIPIIGICGGYQMLGRDLIGSDGSSEHTHLTGMGLLPIQTTFCADKKMVQVQGKFATVNGIFKALEGLSYNGYEIHHGVTSSLESCEGFTIREDESVNGSCAGNVYGTYVHGIFDDPMVCEQIIKVLCEKKGIPLLELGLLEKDVYRQQQFDLLAEQFRKHLDMDAIYRILDNHEMRTFNAGSKSAALEHVLPMQIEQRSFEIIEEELNGAFIPTLHKPIVKRVIHTTADFDYLKNLVFSEMAVQKAVEALQKGACIVTDTSMVYSGIHKSTLTKLGGEAFCYISDEEIAKRAKEEGCTRSALCMEKALEIQRPLIFAVGNAPTALIRLNELYLQGKINPILIIGVPVGFVNVVQSKELILQSGMDYIVAKGRKGGSNVAAAICNALLYMAAKER